MAALLGHIDILPFLYLLAMAFAFWHAMSLLIHGRIVVFIVEMTLLYIAFAMHGGHVSTGIAVMLMPVIVTSLLFRRHS